jgi:hypothetical protein
MKFVPLVTERRKPKVVRVLKTEIYMYMYNVSVIRLDAMPVKGPHTLSVKLCSLTV